jgi:predicted transcriptional regulator
MACIDPDGTLTITAKFLLKELDKGPLPPEDIARALGEPIFRVRGNLRELKEADLILEEDGLFHITELGKEKI